MSKRFNYIFALFCVITTSVNAYGSNVYREKYINTLRHYSRYGADSLKYKAAVFLIDNMDGHVSPEGKSVNSYVARIRTMKKATGIRQLQAEWYVALKQGPVEYLPDSAVVTDSYLINNIDAAFDAWNSAKWKHDITFEQFCKYILPYRIYDEHLHDSWRDALRKQYAPLTKGVSDIRRAFAIVKDSVFKEVVLSNDYCPYNLDPITCNRIGRAECSQRCILLAAVLRALAIPAAVDGTPMWADYSNKGHAWVAMVANNGDTYTVYEQDKIAKKFNPVDASQFLPQYNIQHEDGCLYDIKTTKTPIKIYRMCYEHSNKIDKDTPEMLASPFIQDVSMHYGLSATVRLKVNTNKTVYLCAYLSGVDWKPIAKAYPKNGKVSFKNVGKGSVCVPVTVYNGKLHFMSCPFLIGDNGIVKQFVPKLNDRQSITVNRKYPLCSYITDKWAGMIDGTFEGAMTRTFADADVIGKVTMMPSGMTTINVSSKEKYRYLRYCAPKDNKTSIAELQFYTSDQFGRQHLLTGEHFSNGVNTLMVNNAFDGNPATYCYGQEFGYNVGLDLGANTPETVSKIVFSPSTDLNFVEKNHLYELYYFDTDWHMIKRVYSNGDRLTFDNVPKGALLLLKDKTNGTEERIFEYNGNKQIWH